MESSRLNYWRKFFRGANSDIFDVIENAILVAATDRRGDLRGRRDRIAELLFSCRSARCVGCDRVEVQVPEREEEGGGEFGQGRDCGDCADEGGVGMESNKDGADEGVNQMLSNYSYDEAEALTEEIEEESQIVGEVLRIKEVLANRKDESNSVLFDSLRRLQLMRLSVETLLATAIGKAVNGLRKHTSKQIRHLARTLIDEWKILVEERMNSAPILEETTPESINPSNFDLDDGIDGLPFPPLDEGAFLATQATSVDFSKFFDGMDDDGNPRNFGEFDKVEENRKNPILENHSPSMTKHLTYSNNIPDKEDLVMTRDPISKQTSQQEAQNKNSKSHGAQNKQTRLQEPHNRPRKMQDPPYKPQDSLHEQSKSNANILDSVPFRHQKSSNEYKFNNDLISHPPYVPAEVQRVKSHPPYVPAVVQRKAPTALQNKLKHSEDNSVRAKLEISKRKLQEGYQQAENAKKQRTIQVMEFNDLPKQGLNRKVPRLKPGNPLRRRENGRR